MINATVKNIIRYEIFGVGTEKVLFETENKLKAYEYYHKASQKYGFIFAIRKVTINIKTEVLEGKK